MERKIQDLIRLTEEYGFNPYAQERASSYTKVRTMLALLDLGMVLAYTFIVAAVMARPAFGLISHVVALNWAKDILYTFLIMFGIQLSHLFPYQQKYNLDLKYGLTQPSLNTYWLVMGRLLLASTVGTILFIPIYAIVAPLWNVVEWGSVGPILLYSLYRYVGAWDFGPPKERKRLIDPQWGQIQKIAKKIKVKAPRVTIVDSPKQGKSWAAFFTWSFFERIYLSQSLLDQLTPAEVDAVIAHELAHKQYMIIQIILFYLVWIAPVTVVVSRGLPWFSDLFELNQGVESLPLFIFLAEGTLFAIKPFTNIASRWVERKADLLALRVTDDPDAFASAILKLYDYNLICAAPGRMWQFFFGTHPTGVQRVQLARRASKTSQNGETPQSPI